MNLPSVHSVERVMNRGGIGLRYVCRIMSVAAVAVTMFLHAVIMSRQFLPDAGVEIARHGGADIAVVTCIVAMYSGIGAWALTTNAKVRAQLPIWKYFIATLAACIGVTLVPQIR